MWHKSECVSLHCSNFLFSKLTNNGEKEQKELPLAPIKVQLERMRMNNDNSAKYVAFQGKRTVDEALKKELGKQILKSLNAQEFQN